MATVPPSRQASRAILAILVVLHLALAFWYGTNTPYRTAGKLFYAGGQTIEDVGTPDERQHANYVAELVDGKGYPVFRPQGPDAGEHIEDHQAPLYYTLAAGYAKATGLTGDAIRSPEGKSLRWLNLLVGASTVVGVFAIGLWGFGKREVGLIAAAFAALLPMNVAMSGAVNNDPLLIAFCTWGLALAAKGVREGWSLRSCLALGVVAGLGALTKTSALALFPILALAAYLHRPTRAQFAAVVLPAILLPLPWWIRNQSLYGDFFALKIFKAAFVNTAQASDFIGGMGLFGYLSQVAWWTARSFIGAFGYMDIWLNERSSPGASTPNALYRVMLALLFAAFVGWLLRLRDADREERRVHFLAAGLGIVVVVQFLLFNLQYFQAQARYLFPALGAFSVGIAWGAWRLSKENWRVALTAVVVSLLAVAILAGTILPTEFAKRT